jgi:hypothetical protein
MLGEVGVADGVATARVVLVPVRRDLHDRRHRSSLCAGRQPEVRGEASPVGQRDPEVVDLPDGIALGEAQGHTRLTLNDASAGNVHPQRDFDRKEMGIEPSVFGRWQRKRGARPPDGTNDSDQTQDPAYTADPRELVGPEAVTMAEAPEAAEGRGAEEP